MLAEVARINDEAVQAVVERLRDEVRELSDSRVALLGLSFKPGTDDVRQSPALALASRLLELGAEVVGFDPRAGANAKAELPELRIATDRTTRRPERTRSCSPPTGPSSATSISPASETRWPLPSSSMPATRWTGARSQAPASQYVPVGKPPSARRPEPMPRAVVTGGAGFLGSHVCERLLAEGWHVLCLDTLLTGREDNLAGCLSDPRFAFERTDVTRFITVEGAIDAVVHLASPASPRDYLDHPIHTLKVGALGTLNALGWPRPRARGSCWRPRRRPTAIRW